MSCSRLLVLGCLLVVVSLRLLSTPVYRGVTAAGASDRHSAVAAPFGDELRGSCNAFLSLLGVSLLREGLAATGGIPLLNPQPTSKENFAYYDHHPPGVPWLTAAAFALLGNHEWVARGVALLLSLLTAAWLLLFLRNQGSTPLLVATATLTCVPAGLFWASHLNFEVPTLCFTTLLLIGLSRSEPRPTLRWSLCLIFAFWMDLVALFAVAALLLECLWTPRRWRLALGFAALGAALMLGWWLWRQLQYGRHGHAMGGSAVHHLYAVSFFGMSWSLGEWTRAAGAGLWNLLGGWPLLVLAVELLPALRRKASQPADRLLRMTTTVAVLAYVIPAARSYDHHYYGLYFLIPTVLACARLQRRMAQFQPLRWPIAGLFLIALGATGWYYETSGAAASTTSPASHLLGQELRRRFPQSETVIALPASAAFDDLVTTYYAGKLVTRLAPQDPQAESLRAGLLQQIGLQDRVIQKSDNAQWPSRGEFEALLPP
jgi:hypothetical protein